MTDISINIDCVAVALAAPSSALSRCPSLSLTVNPASRLSAALGKLLWCDFFFSTFAVVGCHTAAIATSNSIASATTDLFIKATP